MALYDRPVRMLMRDMIAELAPDPTAVFTRRDALRWFDHNYPKVKPGTVSAHLLRFSSNSASRHHYNPRSDEALLYQLPDGRFRLHDPATDSAPSDGPPDDQEERVERDVTDLAAEASEFAYEHDLRDFLARNLPLIEPGLRLYDEEGITGVEFPVGGRFVDILAVDQHGDLVVVELKVKRGYDRVVGQLLRYTAWLTQNLAEDGQQVRGMIIAREISPDLRLACSGLPHVELYEYELAVTLERVAI